MASSPILESLHCLDELRADAGFPRRVPGGRNHDVIRPRPGAVQVIGRDDGTYGIVAPLQDGAGNVAPPSYARDQGILRPKYGMAEGVRRDARPTPADRVPGGVGARVRTRPR